MAEHINRPDPYRREPFAPFDSLEREQYAQARAKGHGIKAAASMARVSPAQGTAFEKHAAIRERIRELRQGAETFVGVSKAWLVNQLKINAEQAREENAYKASNEALMLIYKMISEDKSMSHDVARALDPNVSGPELQRALKEKFSGKPKKLPAEGETPPPEPEPDDEAAE